MSLNILSNVALAYEPVWGPSRQLEAVRLRVRTLHPESVDAAHLLGLLSEEWSAESPPLIVSFTERGLLNQALLLSPFDHIQLELPDLGPAPPPEFVQRIGPARKLGHRFVQQTPLARARPDATEGRGPPLGCVMTLSPEEVQVVLQVVDRAVNGGTGPRVQSPVLREQMLEGITSRTVAAHCLDDRSAWGVSGWPVDDTLRAHRHHGVRPDRSTMVRLQQALMRDRPTDVVEDVIHHDPVLTFRVLRLVNSPVFGSTRQVETIRQAILLLGQRALSNWLMEQLPGASPEKDLIPVRHGMVLRARFMTTLMDPGPQAELRAEVYVAGLFSQLDLMTHEPLAKTLARVPLSERITSSLLREDGPYKAYIDIARSVEGFEQGDAVVSLCRLYGFPLDDVNRAIIRTLAHWRNPDQPGG